MLALVKFIDIRLKKIIHIKIYRFFFLKLIITYNRKGGIQTLILIINRGKRKTMSLHYKTLHKLYGFMVHAFCHVYNSFIWFLYMIMLLLSFFLSSSSSSFFFFFWLCEWQPLLSLTSYLLVELLEQLLRAICGKPNGK